MKAIAYGLIDRYGFVDAAKLSMSSVPQDTREQVSRWQIKETNAATGSGHSRWRIK
jgi:hypothetical protein